MKNSVLLYIRKSREDENESKEETLARHERMLFDYCRRCDLNIFGIYKEVVSGESIAARPEAQKLLDEVATGKYNGVVVVDLERLSRGNQIDQAEILEIFKKSKTKIYTLNKTYDFSNDDDLDEDFFEFGLFMSRREYKIINRRLQRGRKQAQKEGYFIGSITPLGFTKEKDGKGFVLQPDGNSDTVRLLFDMFVNQGKPLSELRDFLINSGLRPARATEWTSRRVRQILENQNYIGNLKVKGEWINGRHSAIIPEDIFNAAQIRLQSDSPRAVKKTTLKNPLATICRCSVCGHPLQLSANEMKGKTPIKCRTTNCPTVSTYIEILEPVIISAIQDELQGFKIELQNAPDTYADRKKAIDQEKRLYLSEIKNKREMLVKACELLEQGVYTPDMFKARQTALQGEIDVLQERLNNLDNTSELDEVKRLEDLVPIMENCLDQYWDLNAAGKNEILKTFVDKILYSKTIRNNSHHTLDDMAVEIFLKI